MRTLFNSFTYQRRRVNHLKLKQITAFFLYKDTLKFSSFSSLQINKKNLENMQKSDQCTFVKEEDTASGKWIKLSKITYIDPSGKERIWEAVRRTTRLPGDLPDAVVAIPILRRTLHYDCIVLIKQYRPPIKAYSIEFPAGLLDPKETAETCAQRELKEETGYTGTVKHISPATSLDPGLGNTTAQLVTVEVDGDLPENQNPKAQPDEGEFIEVLNIPIDDMLQKLNDYAATGVVIDSRVYTYAISMEQTKKMMRTQSSS